MSHYINPNTSGRPVLVGPMSSPEDVAELEAVALAVGALPASQAAVYDASQVIAMKSWRRCPIASSDVFIAEAMGVPIDEE